MSTLSATMKCPTQEVKYVPNAPLFSHPPKGLETVQATHPRAVMLQGVFQVDNCILFRSSKTTLWFQESKVYSR